MTESQQHAIAAGFFHILETHHDVYERWARTPKTSAAIGKLIQEEMGLASPPQKADLVAMEAYIEAHLKDRGEKIQEAHAHAPKVGSIGISEEHA